LSSEVDRTFLGIGAPEGSNRGLSNEAAAQSKGPGANQKRGGRWNGGIQLANKDGGEACFWRKKFRSDSFAAAGLRRGGGGLATKTLTARERGRRKNGPEE